jgi:membrane protease YdiL (CAAX protease family)
VGEINVLKELGGSILSFCIYGIVVYFLAIVLKVKYDGFKLSNPRKSALYAILAVMVSALITILLVMSISKTQNTSEAASKMQTYNFNSVLNIAVVWLIILMPILITKKVRKESWESTGVSTHNLRASMLIGAVLAIIILAEVLLFGHKSCAEIYQKLTMSSLWAFAYYAVVGISEEFMFRGYLQMRLMEWLGTWKGWVLTSILMALIHIPQRMVFMGLAPLEAVTSSILLIPISLTLGYIMIKTENIAAPAIYHTFADWVNVLL